MPEPVVFAGVDSEIRVDQSKRHRGGKEKSPDTTFPLR
jgi:hypothetical protein